MKVKKEMEVQATDVKLLRRILSESEYKYSQLSERHMRDKTDFELLKMQWHRVNDVNQNRNRLLEQSSISACQELDSSQTAIDILRRENEELQKILGEQIERRNGTIRELIREKKQLFEQLVSQGKI